VWLEREEKACVAHACSWLSNREHVVELQPVLKNGEECTFFFSVNAPSSEEESISDYFSDKESSGRWWDTIRDR
jgi:hypothetical protein